MKAKLNILLAELALCLLDPNKRDASFKDILEEYREKLIDLFIEEAALALSCDVMAYDSAVEIFTKEWKNNEDN